MKAAFWIYSKTFSMKKIMILLIGMSIFTSCKNSETESQDKITTKTSTSPNLNCLSKLDLRYDELLPLDDVARILNMSPDEFKTKTIDRKDSYGEVYYSWESDRPSQPSPVSEHVMVPDNNFIGFSSLNAYDADLPAEAFRERFDTAYKEMSEEEIAQMEARMEKHLENKTEEERETVKGFVGARKSSGFEKVDNLGDAAYWRFNTERGGEMVTLSGNETFTVYTKISHDPDENFDLAKKLVQLVMNNCED